MAYSHRNDDLTENRLFILNGELRGVSITMDGKDVRIGSGTDCDLTLLNVDELNSEAVIAPKADDGYMVGNSIGRVRLGSRYLKPAHRRILPPGVPLTVGHTDLAIAPSLASADHSVRVHRRRSAGLVWAASLAVAVGAIGLVGFSSERSMMSIEADAGIERPVSIGESQAFTPPIAARALRDRLDQNGLGRLEIEVDRANRLVQVSGRLRQSEADRWRDATAWFDRNFSNSVQLRSSFTSLPDSITIPFEIKTVWTGAVPRLTLHDGSKRRAGDPLPGGWRLDSIAADGVTISKDGETLQIAL